MESLVFKLFFPMPDMPDRILKERYPAREKFNVKMEFPLQRFLVGRKRLLKKGMFPVSVSTRIIQGINNREKSKRKIEKC